MVLQSNGPISFLDIKNEFNPTGTNSIKFSDYYYNSATNYTNGILNIPLSGTNILLSNFYNKLNLAASIKINNILTNWIIDGINIYYIFTDTSSIYANMLYIYRQNIIFQILLVGGGGSGGNNIGGGGGGGFIYYNDSATFTLNNYYIIIGTGASAPSLLSTTKGNTGGSTYIANTSMQTKFDIGGGGTGGTTNSYSIGGNSGYYNVLNGSTFNNVFNGTTGTSTLGGLGAGAGGTNGSGYDTYLPTGNTINTYSLGGYGGDTSHNFVNQPNYGSGGSGGKINMIGNAGNNGVAIIRFKIFPTILVNNISNSWINNGSKKYYIFTNTTNNYNKIIFNANTECEILIIGGGGGGGINISYDYAGNGGSGGSVYYNSSYIFTKNIYTINVGIGGSVGNNGGSTSIVDKNNNTILNVNGGGSVNGTTILNNNNTSTTYYSANGVYNNFYNTYDGGGGAGANGNGNSINGGIGFSSTITGSTISYAGGGASYTGNTSRYGSYGSSGTYGTGGRAVGIVNEPGTSGISGCVIISFNNN